MVITRFQTESGKEIPTTKRRRHELETLIFEFTVREKLVHVSQIQHQPLLTTRIDHNRERAMHNRASVSLHHTMGQNEFSYCTFHKCNICQCGVMIGLMLWTWQHNKRQAVALGNDVSNKRQWLKLIEPEWSQLCGVEPIVDTSTSPVERS